MTDAASIKPKFIPDDKLRPRDDSGGYGFKGNRTADWGDGGEVYGGDKPHLTPGGRSSSDNDYSDTTRAVSRRSGRKVDGMDND